MKKIPRGLFVALTFLACGVVHGGQLNKNSCCELWGGLNDESNENFLLFRIQSACKSVMNVWDVFKLLGTITIAPHYRHILLRKTYTDVAQLFSEVSVISSLGGACPFLCRGLEYELIDLDERLRGAVEIFSIACGAYTQENEKLISIILERAQGQISSCLKILGLEVCV
ncbi:MAG: hypothetical protein JW725_03280 [Candidatus Babeliaceae bacterium]|nr:hypothetical protein [Candidatus Babeliaceae bacterium]